MRSRSQLRDYLEALLVAVLFASFARTYVVQAFKIPTGSMEQNLLIGDHILVNKFVYSPAAGPLARRLLPHRRVERGDIVVFKFPQDPLRDFIKRCVALPGDTIELRDKVLWVNGRELDETDYVFHTDSRVYPESVFLPEDYRWRDNLGPLLVPEGHLFFLGDNRDNSNDSRFWGPVPASLVKGRALLVYWSFRSEREGAWPGYVGRLKQLATVLVRFPTHTRWERSLMLVR